MKYIYIYLGDTWIAISKIPTRPVSEANSELVRMEAEVQRLQEILGRMGIGISMPFLDEK